MISGYEVTVKIGINAHSKNEAEKQVKEWLKILDCPVWLVGVE